MKSITEHSVLSSIPLIKCGFTIEAIDEPLPSEEALKTREGLKKEFIKPTFLIVKAKKTLYCSNDNDI